MRARLARPRRIVRGRLVAPVAAAAAVALVGGVVVATPDAPIVREDVQTVAVTFPEFKAGAAFSYDLDTVTWAGAQAGFVVTGVTGLPDGVGFNTGTGVIEGTPTESGFFQVTISGTVNGQPQTVVVPVVVFNADGTAPAGTGSAAALQGGLGGEAQAGGQVTTGSDGTDALLGAVASIVVALGGDAGLVSELATGSTGGTEGTGDTQTPTGPLGSVTDSLLGTTPGQPDQETTPGSDSLGSSATGDAQGGATGDLNTESLGPLGSVTDTDTDTTTTGSSTGGDTTTRVGADLTTGGEVTVPGSSVPGMNIPGSSTTGTTGSLGDMAPTLALTGAALLGLAGLSIILNGGSSTPGTTSSLPALPGSSTTTGGNGGSSGSSDTPGGPNGSSGSSDTPGGPNGSTGPNSNGSTGPVAPTVAAGAPEKKSQAPGPVVANGRG